MITLEIQYACRLFSKATAIIFPLLLDSKDFKTLIPLIILPSYVLLLCLHVHIFSSLLTFYINTHFCWTETPFLSWSEGVTPGALWLSLLAFGSCLPAVPLWAAVCFTSLCLAVHFFLLRVSCPSFVEHLKTVVWIVSTFWKIVNHYLLKLFRTVPLLYFQNPITCSSDFATSAVSPAFPLRPPYFYLCFTFIFLL